MSYYTKEASLKLAKCTKDKNPIKFTKEKSVELHILLSSNKILKKKIANEEKIIYKRQEIKFILLMMNKQGKFCIPLFLR